ncbi:MAG: hypothetical protein NTY45_01365 [Elusimicrobia bacterium]|nr:hypothetical protein [Elusimicrobiota bacterium]
MIKLQSKKKKASQYVIGGTVAVIILGLWISLPLMNGTSSSSSDVGNPFRSKVSDISTLGADIPQEGSAPGSPLSGEMTNNPATSGEQMASSLFQSGPEADAPAASASADAGAPAPSAGPVPASGPGAASPSGGPGGKLAAVASISGSNSGSMTAGNTHSKFFGSGNQEAKFAAPLGNELKKAALTAPEKKDVSAMLNNAVAQSKQAAKAPNMDASRGDATTAFGSSSKGASSSDLNGKSEESSAVSGLAMGEAAADLKKSDPSLSHNKVTPPSPPAVDTSMSENDQMKKMIMQMILQSVLGMAFPMPTGGK